MKAKMLGAAEMSRLQGHRSGTVQEGERSENDDAGGAGSRTPVPPPQARPSGKAGSSGEQRPSFQERMNLRRSGPTSVRLPLPGANDTRPVPQSGIAPQARISTRISLSGVGQGAWQCAKCKIGLPKDALAKGAADLVAGNLLCKSCLGVKEKKKPQGIAFWKFGAGAVIAAGLLAVILPGYMLFILGLASLVLVFTGLISFTLRSVVRVILSGLGACGLVISIWSTIYLNDKQALSEEEKEWASAAAGINEALHKGSYLEAQKRYRTFMALAMPRPGSFRSVQAEQKATEIREAMEEWLKRAYGSLGPKDISVLANLMTLFGEKAVGGEKRFSDLQVTEETVSLRMIVDLEPDTEAGRSEEEAVLDKARMVLKTLRSVYPEVPRTNLHLAVESNASDRREFGTVAMDRPQEHVLDSSGDLRPLFKAVRK